MTANERIEKLRLAWTWLTVAGRRGEANVVRDNVRMLAAIEGHRVRQSRRPTVRKTYAQKAIK